MSASPARSRSSRASARAASEAASNELMATLTTVVERLGSAVVPTTEIVLHDLRRLPNSIIAVAGNVTDRSVGDPPTDLLLSHMASGADGDLISYPTDLPDGRRLQSSTIIFRDDRDDPVAALCVNNDITHWLLLRGVADSVISGQHPLAEVGGPAGLALALAGAGAVTAEPVPPPPGERFARDVDELAAHMISRAIDEVGVPVELMKKEHKIRVVSQLRARGMFLIRDAIETVAASLDVSRFTIYNYLNELSANGDGNPADWKPPATTRATRAKKGTS